MIVFLVVVVAVAVVSVVSVAVAVDFELFSFVIRNVIYYISSIF